MSILKDLFWKLVDKFMANVHDDYILYVLVILIAATSNAQTLKHRTEPTIHVESCSDHLMRLSRDFRYGSDIENDKMVAYHLRGLSSELFWMSKNLRTMPASIDICSKRRLSELDIQASLLNLRDAYQANSCMVQKGELVGVNDAACTGIITGDNQ